MAKHEELRQMYYAMKIGADALADISRIMFAKGNVNDFSNYRCECCCEEHTFDACPARWWGGCRSGIVYNPIKALKKMEAFMNQEFPDTGYEISFR